MPKIKKQKNQAWILGLWTLEPGFADSGRLERSTLEWLSMGREQIT